MSGNILFITLMGAVSLFSDMTHEGARSILGPFLSMTGASAAAIAIVSGAGELCGYSLRLLSGFVADKTHRYWALVITGYTLQVASVPALALVGQGGWIAACALVILERVAKAVKKPAKNTLVSFAASGIGMGKGFAYQEVLDQIGAFAGPVMLFLIAHIKAGVKGSATGADTFSTYRLCFAALAIPAAITVAFTLISRAKYPHPETFEEEHPAPLSMHSNDAETEKGVKKLKKEKTSSVRGNIFRADFLLYMITISLFAFGFADFPLLSLHASRTGAFNSADIALLYALAMLTDALSALIFGTLFDSIGALSLAISTLFAAVFAPLVFMSGNRWSIIAGIAIWGIGMGAEESVMKACVADALPKNERARGFGTAETGFGIAWFLGSIAMGVLYDKNRLALSMTSTAALVASSIFALIMAKNKCRTDREQSKQ